MAEHPSKNFWNERYRSGKTPWDYGGVPPEFARFLQTQSWPLRLLIPGCGSAHDLLAALRSGHDVIGLDLSEEAVRLARSRLAAAEEWRVIEADFFAAPLTPGSFDVVYERTFLCAIPPEMRRLYVTRVLEQLKPGGFLLGYFLYGEEADPPPYPLGDNEDDVLLLPEFVRIESKRSEAPLPFFEGMEKWQIWQKPGTPTSE